MFIIAGKVYVYPEHREEYLAGFEKVIRLARSQPGCLGCVYSADPLEEGCVNQFEHWQSEEHFAAWQAVVDPRSLLRKY